MANVQSWNPENYARNARFVADLGQPVLDLLAARPGERILDLGCGDGALTRKLIDLGCQVVGVDASAPQVEAARAQNVDARVMTGEDLAFGPEFDAVFSNAALHWMPDAERVLAGVYTALRPGGRFVAECGGYGCVDTLRRALIASLRARGHDGDAADPWYFPTVEDYTARLVSAGFEISYAALIPRPTPLPGDVLGWLETFAPTFTRVLPPAERAAYLADVREQVRPRLCDSEGKWSADYVRLRFAATKPLGAATQRGAIS